MILNEEKVKTLNPFQIKRIIWHEKIAIKNYVTLFVYLSLQILMTLNLSSGEVYNGNPNPNPWMQLFYRDEVNLEGTSAYNSH